MNPEVVESYTVGGRVVAVPYRTDIGVLFYRKDLLRDYGYQAPPKTWDELETMAARIQQGERAKGQKNFWGFLWPGAAGEGLICNALEWQAAEGGGQIIEADRTISVNNPRAIRSWQRAAHWGGWISPPSITSYGEWDAINTFFSGRAAFFRGWELSYLFGLGSKPVDPNRFGIANVPGGKGGQAGTLGGFGLGVPLASPHPKEALKLVQFLVEREKHAEVAKAGLADVWKIQWSGGIVSRPSVAAGDKYEEVDHAYIQAVHSVLTGEVKAPAAAAALEKQLVSITGFKTGPPLPSRSRPNVSAKGIALGNGGENRRETPIHAFFFVRQEEDSVNAP
jgi:trehalose/maltose transport system substrate-binding protein